MLKNNSQANENVAQGRRDVSSQLSEIAGRGTRLALGVQKLIFYEIMQANKDALEHARSGMSTAQEFVAKFARAHSVKDLAVVFRGCGHQQMDRFQRSYEHLFTHGHEVFEVSSNLVLAALRGEAPAKPTV